MNTSLTALKRAQWIGQSPIAKREPFRAASMTGIDGRSGSGRLPRELAADYYNDEPSYTVLSYSTPIAWFGARGWVVPDVKYSSTTSHHQSIVRVAVVDYAGVTS